MAVSCPCPYCHFTISPVAQVCLQCGRLVAYMYRRDDGTLQHIEDVPHATMIEPRAFWAERFRQYVP